MPPVEILRHHRYHHSYPNHIGTATHCLLKINLTAVCMRPRLGEAAGVRSGGDRCLRPSYRCVKDPFRAAY